MLGRKSPTMTLDLYPDQLDDLGDRLHAAAVENSRTCCGLSAD
jgi:hypothetical protein